jgi:hypothetical protein
MKKPPPSRPRSESFEQYNGWGPFYRQILRAHISAPPQKTLLPIARRTVRFRRPVLHVQGGTRREKTFGQQAGLVLARRRSQQAPRSGRSAARRAAPAMPREGGVGIRPPSERASSDFQTVKWAVRRLEARIMHGATHLFGRSRPRGRVGRPRGGQRLRCRGRGGVEIRPPSEPVISDFHTVKWAVRRLKARIMHGATHLSARSRRRGRVDRRRGRRRLRWQRPGAARQLLRQWAECEVLSRLTFREHNLLPELIVQGQSLFDPGSSLVVSGEIVTKLTSLHPSQVISAGLLHELQPGYWRVSHGNQRHSGSTVRSREAVSAKRAKRATPTLTLPSARWRAPC